MRILVISNLYPPFVLGGYEILCAQVCDELCRLGHEVHVLTSDHGLASGASETADGAEISRDLRLYLPFDRPGELQRRQRASTSRANYAVTAAHLAQVRPDIVFVWSLLRLTVGPARAAQDSGIPVAYTFNDENISSYRAAGIGPSPRRIAASALDRFVMPDATLRGLSFRHSTCISRRLKENLLALNLPVERAEVIYQGIPIERFPLKSEPGQLHDPVRVLYAGQLHAYKGVHTLISAAHRAVAAGARLTVNLVGDGPADYRERLHLLAGQGPAEIRFAGKAAHDRMPETYRDHDLLVFPSIWPEPFGLTHLEAMASGLPVISTAGGGQGEFLLDNDNALVFPEDDEVALAERLVRLAGDPDLARRLAHRGRETVAEQFTLQGYVRRLEAFLQEILKEVRP